MNGLLIATQKADKQVILGSSINSIVCEIEATLIINNAKSIGMMMSDHYYH